MAVYWKHYIIVVSGCLPCRMESFYFQLKSRLIVFPLGHLHITS